MRPDGLGKKIRTRIITVEGMYLEYSLIRSKIRANGRFSYSVVLDQSSDGEHDRVYCADLTRDRRRAERIFSQISDGAVTACTFFDVIEDMI